jgi:hypothetical protein
VDSIFPKFFQPAPDIVWRPEIEAGAAMYMLGASLHFVTPGSVTERDIVAAGGLRVGTLRFDRDPTERTHPNRPVRALAAATALREMRIAPDRN